MLTVMLLAAMEKALLMMAVIFLALGAIGLFEAWRKKRGALGWFVSFIVSIAGGAVTMVLGVAIGDALVRLQPEVGEGLLMLIPILMLAGSWLAVRLVNRFRDAA